MVSLSTNISKVQYGMLTYKYPNDNIKTLSDKEYDFYKNSLPSYSVYNYINWDDIDLIPISNQWKDELGLNPNLSSEQDYVNVIKGKYASSKSMVMENSFERLVDFLQTIVTSYHQLKKDVEINISYKLDGWHVRNFFDKNKLMLSNSKAKDTDNIMDFTDALREIIYKNNLTLNQTEPLCIQGELCLNKCYLPYLRNKYQKPFKNVRNSISSFTSGKLNKEDIILPTFFAFNIIKENGETLFNKISDTYSFLHKCGFNIPPNHTIKVPYCEDINTLSKQVASSFQTVYTQMEKYFKEKFMNEFEADGLVIQANHQNIAQDITLTNSTNYNYSTGMLAFKGGEWGKEYFEATVQEIIFASSKQNREPILILEPCETGYSTITRCEINNLNTLLKEKIKPKDKILISVHSRQIIQYEKKI